MTEYKFNEGDLVRATNGDTVIEARMVSTYDGPTMPYLGLTPNETGRRGWSLELIEAAKSPTVKALEDAPVGSYVTGVGEGLKRIIKSRNGKWYVADGDDKETGFAESAWKVESVDSIAAVIESSQWGFKLYVNEA